MLATYAKQKVIKYTIEYNNVCNKCQLYWNLLNTNTGQQIYHKSNWMALSSHIYKS